MTNARFERARRVVDSLGGRVAVVGSVNADLRVETENLPGPGETVVGGALEVLPGGKSANQSVAASLIGAPTSLIGAVGEDVYGTMLIDSLSRAGVSIDAVHVREGASGTAVITVDSRGENTIVISAGANATLSPGDAAEGAEIIRSAGALGLCLEVNTATVLKAAQIAHNSGVTVVLNYSPIVEIPTTLLGLVDVLIVNEHELAALAGHEVDPDDLDAIRSDVRALGVGSAVLTLGGRGAIVLDRKKTETIDALEVEVVDTTGAGDAFMGALLAGLASNQSLADAAILASVTAGLATTGRGAQPSYVSAEQLKDYWGS